MTASFYHRWGIAPSVDVRDSGLPGVRLRPRGRPVRTSGYARWNHLNRDVQTLGNARAQHVQLTGKRHLASFDSRLRQSLRWVRRLQDRRSLRGFGVAEDEL